MEYSATQNFGTVLKELRKKRSLTQEQMAEFMGISSQAVSKWENNISYPDISLLPVLANFFQVSIDELLRINVTTNRETIEKLCKDADELFKEQKYAEAAESLQAALKKYPGNDQLMYRLAWAFTGTMRDSLKTWKKRSCFT